MRFIKSAQRLGFSLDEIGDLLKLDDGSHCTEAREQAERKLVDVRAKLADLHRIETVFRGSWIAAAPPADRFSVG